MTDERTPLQQAIHEQLAQAGEHGITAQAIANLTGNYWGASTIVRSLNVSVRAGEVRIADDSPTTGKDRRWRLA